MIINELLEITLFYAPMLYVELISDRNIQQAYVRSMVIKELLSNIAFIGLKMEFYIHCLRDYLLDSANDHRLGGTRRFEIIQISTCKYTRHAAYCLLCIIVKIAVFLS